MDELTLLRSTRDDTLEPTPEALAAGRAALLDRATGGGPAEPTPERRRSTGVVSRMTWSAAGLAAAATLVIVAGNLTMTAQSARADEVLRGAAAETVRFADPTPGSGQYVRSLTHARWASCTTDGCVPNDQILDVYMPADPDAEWVLVRDWGDQTGLTGESVETHRALDGGFYGPEHSWVLVDFADIPLDGAAAYEWVDGQYVGGSASRDEDNFVRIADILRSGLVPAPQRAALFEALARIPGVSATEGVANLDGVVGVAIGRTEPFRAGARQEIIIDPATGLVIGERMLSGATLFGWGPSGELSLTAIETTVVDTAP